MLRYSLRTLLLIVLIAGPLLAWGWGYVERVIEERREAEAVALEAERVRVAEAQRHARLTAIIKQIGRDLNRPTRRWVEPPQDSSR